MKSKKSFESIVLKGHLFDTFAINKILDYLEKNDLDFNIAKFEFGKNIKEETKVIL